MTSKNSFLVSSKENNKRRIWVWVISILGQLLLYPGILTIYLSRISFRNADGVYDTPELYENALQEAAADALGFQPFSMLPIALLGILIAVQGFSYLYDRKKVDMYYSVPVSSKRRFAVIYGNGLFIYVIPALSGILTGILIASAQGAMSGRCMAECGLALLLNLLYFLVVYHTAVLAVMLTGNVIITGFAAAILLGIVYVASFMLQVLRNAFFETATSFFTGSSAAGSVITDYDHHIYRLKQASQLSDVIQEILPVYGKWFVSALFFLALAYLAYRKRPAEAAGKAVAFNWLKPVVKIAVSVVAGLIVCWIVYDATYYNAVLAALSMTGGTALCCIVMEVIYEADIRGAFRHLVSTGAATACIVLIFCIYKFDLPGYDSYVPEAGEIESFVLDIGPYQNYWEWNGESKSIRYRSDSEYYAENMFLTDADALCELAHKSRETDAGSMEDCREVRVLYRLRSGKEVSRCFWIDFGDASNEELINRIIGTQEYRDGFYLLANEAVEIPCAEMEREWEITYTNGTIETQLPASESERLREMWLKDMEQFDFTLAHQERPCGQLKWEFRISYTDLCVPVYESFTNTLAVLREYQAYYPIELRAEDILSVEITNRHEQDQDAYFDADAAYAVAAEAADTNHSVTKEFTDPYEIAEIVKNVYPSGSMPSLYWNEADITDRDYEVVITFKTDTDYPYKRGYFQYVFLKDRVPDFVVEKTAFGAEDQG
ncbi:MAG: hypothetical protein NC341_01945 [Blautia sp.]|nr:hypothetical protein [Blautia sp.]MCM1200381.1 hypothetical protein [Bacteroides fragilis]